MGLTSSRGKRPARLHSSMMGTRLSSMNLRVVSRTSRSSSVRSESNWMKSTPRNLMAGMKNLLAGQTYDGSRSKEWGQRQHAAPQDRRHDITVKSSVRKRDKTRPQESSRVDFPVRLSETGFLRYPIHTCPLEKFSGSLRTYSHIKEIRRNEPWR